MKASSDGKYPARSIYCHFDGYIAGVGKTLLNHYTDPEKVNDLMRLGDLSSLGKERKSTNIIPVVSDTTDLINKIDHYFLGFQKLFKLIIGPTKKAAKKTFESMGAYATCNNKKENC